MKDLEAKIIYHRTLYAKGEASISDEDYDALERELFELDPSHPLLKKVGATLKNRKPITHKTPMLSLEKTYKENDIEAFLEKGELLAVPKIDGSSCSLVYREGVFMLGKTRGDGVTGEEITEKIKAIKNVPKTIPLEHGEWEIRGEICCKEESFHHLVKDMNALGLEAPSSRRNIVAGLLMRKDHSHLCQHLSFMAFDVLDACATEEEMFYMLKDYSFEVPPFQKCVTKEDIHKVIKEYSEEDSFSYLVDGIVFSLNNKKSHQILGNTLHHPRYKLAFKWMGQTKWTEVLRIEWSISRNGIFTPVAIIKPVELSQATINRVTLHNYGTLEEFGIGPGTHIEIIRSGEVIPKFLRVGEGKKTSDEVKHHIPQYCPHCLGVITQEEIRLKCLNKECPGRMEQEVLYWIKESGIEDLSEKRLHELFRLKLVKNIKDLYRLTKEDFLQLDKVKDRLAEKLFSQIQKTRELELEIFLSALGIEGISRNRVNKIFEECPEIQTVTDFFQRYPEKKMIALSLLESEGGPIRVKDRKSTVSVKAGKLQGVKIAITGALPVSRVIVEKWLKQEGAIIVSTVTKETQYLLTQDTEGDSSKWKQAKKWGVPIINHQHLCVEYNLDPECLN